MGLVLILIALIPAPKPSEQALMNFTRFAKAVGQPIALVDREGAVRQGVLASVGADAVTMNFAGGDRVFMKSEIASAERLRDSSKDGLIKGALFGTLLGLYLQGEFGSSANGAIWLRTVGAYGAIGWALDAANKNRQPIYRGASTQPTVKLSLRF